MNLIDKLRNSGVKLLQTEAEDLAKWSKLRHTKQDLELFLRFNIAEIQYSSKKNENKSIICTSDTAFINAFKAKKIEDKKALSLKPSADISVKDLGLIRTWDLEADNFRTIPIYSWQIVNFISITPQNILILDEVIHNII